MVKRGHVSVRAGRALLLTLWPILSFSRIDSLSAQHQQPERRLPIRGESLLRAIMAQPGPPVSTELTLSADGSHILQAEVKISQFADTSRLPCQGKGDGYSDWTVWALDVASGRRDTLPGLIRRNLSGGWLNPEFLVDFQAQWSANGRDVAFLDRRECALGLVVWTVGANRPPIRIALPVTKLATAGAKTTIRNWAWYADRGEVLLDLEIEDTSVVPTGGTGVTAKDTTTWAWILSQAQSATLRHQGEPSRPQSSRRLVAMHLQDQTVRTLDSGTSTADTMGVRGYWYYGAWSVRHDRPGVIISTHDRRLDAFAYESDKALWLLHT
jgi:hypothetical protein